MAKIEPSSGIGIELPPTMGFSTTVAIGVLHQHCYICNYQFDVNHLFMHGHRIPCLSSQKTWWSYDRIPARRILSQGPPPSRLNLPPATHMTPWDPTIMPMLYKNALLLALSTFIAAVHSPSIGSIRDIINQWYGFSILMAIVACHNAFSPCSQPQSMISFYL